MIKVDRQTWVFAAVLAVVVSALYSIGLTHLPVFDDARLSDGSIYGRYGALWPLQSRMLSYGSFVWVDALAAGSLVPQRVFNLVLHLATALAVAALVRRLLEVNTWPDALRHSIDLDDHIRHASLAAALLWAVHPVAVYGVNYLIQRSIVMATLFVVLALLCFVHGLQRRQPVWHAAAAVLFGLAMASKEYAITALLLVPVLLVHVRRPGMRTLLISAVAAAGALALAAVVLVSASDLLPRVIGQVFDDISAAHVAQLNKLSPGVADAIYPLSIINQAALFWRYGLTWFFPAPTLMAIDLRPAFPLGFVSVQMLGAVAYVLALAGSAWVLVRQDGLWRLLALAVLIPGLLFVTEFATVWVQDPFVLYRSYLWSIGFAVAAAALLVRMEPPRLWLLAAFVAFLLAALTVGRISSLGDSRSAWSDAAAKINQQAPANAVGRWRPFTNLGADALERGNYAEAVRQLTLGARLGEPLGSAQMNLGVAYQQLSMHDQALAAFDQASQQGFADAALHYHRAESQLAQRNTDDALTNYGRAIDTSRNADFALQVRAKRAEVLISLARFDDALADYTALLAQRPDAQRYIVGKAMAYRGKRQYAESLRILDEGIARRATPGMHFARALTYFDMGNPQASVADLAIALRAEPQNPAFLSLQQRLQAGGTPSR